MWLGSIENTSAEIENKAAVREKQGEDTERERELWPQSHPGDSCITLALGSVKYHLFLYCILFLLRLAQIAL